MGTFRSKTYTTGVTLLFVACGVYLVGLWAPYWARAELGNLLHYHGDIDDNGSSVSLTFHEGLWRTCISAEVLSETSSSSSFSSSSSIITVRGCQMYETPRGEASLPILIHAHHAVLGVNAVLFLGLCLYYLLLLLLLSPGHHHHHHHYHYYRYGLREAPRRGVPAFLAVFAGLLGLAGCALYEPLRLPALSSLSPPPLLLHWTKDWAFYWTLLASCLSVLAGGLLTLHETTRRNGFLNGGSTRLKTVTIIPRCYNNKAQPRSYFFRQTGRHLEGLYTSHPTSASSVRKAHTLI